MRHYHHFIILIFTFLLPSLSLADSSIGSFLDPVNQIHEKQDPIYCKNIPGGCEECYRQCTSLLIKHADKRLNDIYQKTIKEADKQVKTYYQDMQRAWIQLRDNQCGLIAYYYQGGTAEDGKRMDCVLLMTEQRIEVLESLTKESN